MGVEIAMVGAKTLDTGVIERTARVGVEVSAPIVRPFPAVPRVESIVMLDMHHAGSPVMIDVDMIEADVIVIKVVPPTPAIRPPPRMAPRPQPFAGSKPEAEPHSPIVREPHSKPVRTGPANP